MDLVIITAFVRDTSDDALLNFARWILDNNPEVDRVSFDFYGHLKTFSREDVK